MNDFAKTFIIIGILLILIGLSFSMIGKIPYIGKLPSDIFIKKDHFTFYFPITTCIVISLILSLIIFLWHQK